MGNLAETKRIIDNSKIIELLSKENNTAIPHKKELIAYLRNGKVEAVAAGRATDLLTGERIQEPWLLLTDEVYGWDSSLAYYVEKYNLPLPSDFVQHALDKIVTGSSSTIEHLRVG